MADLEKGNSTADSNKKNAALDEDFGKDFLNFWESSKKGKDSVDFDMEEVLQNKKKSFNFDKLDDVELGGCVAKLPSFKMDMPDLDFSSPVMKAEKPTEKHIGKQESEHEKFSFNFDFNELDRFDISLSPVKGYRELHRPADSNAFGYSFKHVRNLGSRSNSDTSTDLFQKMGKKKPLNSDSMAISRPENLMEATKDSRPSISEDLELHDEPHEVQTSSAKEIAHAEENKNEAQRNDGHRGHPQETCLIGANVEKTTQDFILQAVSADCSAQEDNPEVQGGPLSSDAVNVDSAREIDYSMRTFDNSHSRSSRPVNSYDVGCCPEKSVIESPNAAGDLQKHCNQDQNEVTSGNGVQRQPTKGQNDMQNTSQMKNNADKQNSDPKFILSPLQKDSRPVHPKSLNQKVAASLQLNSLSKSMDCTSWKTSSTNKKQPDSGHSNKIKTLNMYPASENRESKQNHKQADNWKLGLLESNGEGSNKGTAGISRSEKDDLQSDTSSASIRRSKTVHVGINETSLKDNSTCDSRLTISSITKMNCKMLNLATPKEAKSVRFSERRLEIPLNLAAETKNSVLTEKSGSMNSFLKRKTFEESPTDPANLKPLKRAMKPTTWLKSFEVSQKYERASVPKTNNLETCHNDDYTVDLVPNREAMLGSLKDSEAPELAEKHRNTEKVQELHGESLLKQITAAEENSKNCHCSTQEHLPQLSTNSASLDAGISDAKEQDDRSGTVDSSQSRSTSPVSSYDTGCYQGQGVRKPLNAGGGSQEHNHGNQNEVSGRNEVPGESSPNQMEIHNASATHLSKKIAHAMKNNSDNQNSYAEIIQSPLPSFQLETSSLQQNIGRNTAKGIILNSISTIASGKSSKMVHVEMNGSSPKDEKTFGSRLNISSMTKFNSKAQNFAITKEANSGRFSEGNSEFLSRTASKMANSITQRSASFSTPLKRKIFEDSGNSPKNSNPLKCVMELTFGRKPYEVSSRMQRAVVPGTEKLEAFHNNSCAEDLDASGIPELDGSTSIDIPEPTEKDENTEKAEAYIKKLDDMCNMLMKKHEDARELLVRAIVNNNALLMLNHPLFEEKIQSLQRFATSLQSKNFF